MPIPESITSSEPVTSALPTVVTELRRAIRRRVAARAGLTPLPSAQLELLRLVRDHEGLRVQEASTLLRLAPNSISTLVKQLAAAGLLARWADPNDGRATRLRLTPTARGRMAHWRDERQSVIASAFNTLAPADRRAIEAAMSPLRRMAAAIEAERS